MNLLSLFGYKNGHPAIPVAPIPSRSGPTAQEVTADIAGTATELAAVLSPSQVKTYLDCQCRWWYKHGLGLPDYKTAALGLGTAVHQALSINFREKIASQNDLDLSSVVEAFKVSWSAQTDEIHFSEDDDPDDLQACGLAMVETYMQQVAPKIQPAAVDVDVRGAVADVRVRGFIDVLDTQGRVIDVKTAKQKPSGIDPMYRFQVASYSYLCAEASGTARLDTITKTKTINVVEQSFSITDKDLVQIHRIYPLAQEGMRSGLYMPNRGSNLCSRKHCPFADRCEDDYGGVVNEK